MLVVKNRIVSIGWNHRKSHPFQLKFGNNSKSLFFHAETHAIKQATRELELSDFRKATLYVARAKKDCNGRWWYGLAMPCNGCARCIDAFGIPNVVFTTDEGTWNAYSKN